MFNNDWPPPEKNPYLGAELESHQKVPAAQALSSPSREAAEDNVEEREKFWVRRNYGLLTAYLRLTDNGGWTDRRRI